MRKLKREDLIRLGNFLKVQGFLDYFDPKEMIGYYYARIGNLKVKVEYDFNYEPDVKKIIGNIFPSDIICIGWDTANKVEKTIKEISYKLNPEKFKWIDNPDEKHWKHYETQTKVEKTVIDFINFYKNL